LAGETGGTRGKRLGVEGVRSATGSAPESTGIRARRFQSRNPVSSIASNETTTAKIDTFVFGFISTPFTLRPSPFTKRAIADVVVPQSMTRYLIKLSKTSSKEIETTPVRLAPHARTRTLSSTSAACRAVTVFCAVAYVDAVAARVRVWATRTRFYLRRRAGKLEHLQCGVSIGEFSCASRGRWSWRPRRAIRPRRVDRVTALPRVAAAPVVTVAWAALRASPAPAAPSTRGPEPGAIPVRAAAAARVAAAAARRALAALRAVAALRAPAGPPVLAALRAPAALRASAAPRVLAALRASAAARGAADTTAARAARALAAVAGVSMRARTYRRRSVVVRPASRPSSVADRRPAVVARTS